MISNLADVLHTCKKDTSFISIVPFFVYIFILSYLRMTVTVG
jgi:hypothetical protein